MSKLVALLEHLKFQMRRGRREIASGVLCVVLRIVLRLVAVVAHHIVESLADLAQSAISDEQVTRLSCIEACKRGFHTAYRVLHVRIRDHTSVRH